MSVNNPPRPKTYNAYMTASGWGTLYCKVQSVTHGISIVSSGTRARRGRTVYITRRTSSSYSADFVCASYAEYDRFGQWIKGYGDRLAAPVPTVGPIRLVCPSRDLDRIAIPDGITFGDWVDAVTYPISIRFMGTSDPVTDPKSSVFSRFTLPGGSTDPSLPYYYPSGTQLSGRQEGADAIFDVPPKPISGLDPSPPRAPRPPRAPGGPGSQRPM